MIYQEKTTIWTIAGKVCTFVGQVMVFLLMGYIMYLLDVDPIGLYDR